jgi:CubicO group peptidase (beta-lactamase class C family)
MATFGQLFLNEGRAGAVQLLAPATVAAMLRDHVAGLEEAASADRWAPAAGRGLAWRLNTRLPASFCDLATPTAFSHGGAYGALLLVDPAVDLVIAFTANRAGWPGHERRYLLNAIYAAMSDESRVASRECGGLRAASSVGHHPSGTTRQAPSTRGPANWGRDS